MLPASPIVISDVVNENLLGSTFEAANDDSYLDNLVDQLAPNFEYEHKDDKKALSYFVYKTFKLYEHAKERSTTKLPYVNHAFLVAQILGDQRTSSRRGHYRITNDIITLIAALGHDGPEEFYDAMIRKTLLAEAEDEYKQKRKVRSALNTARRKLKKGRTNDRVEELVAEFDDLKKAIKRKKKAIKERFKPREEEFHQQYLTNMREELTRELTAIIDPGRAHYIIGNVLEVMGTNLLTRKQGERYYDTVKKFFSENGGVSPENRKRASIIKFADCAANTIELEHDYVEAVMRRRQKKETDIDHEEVVATFAEYAGEPGKAERELRMKAEIATRKKHQKKNTSDFRHHEKLYRCYKNLILVNAYRVYKKEFREIPEIYRIKLLRETEEVANDILTELCTKYTKHPGHPHRALGFAEIYDVNEENERALAEGVYETVTEPDESSDFHGTLRTFFDTRVRGDETNLKALYRRDKLGLYRTALALRTLAKKYTGDPDFVLEGFADIGDQPIISDVPVVFM